MLVKVLKAAPPAAAQREQLRREVEGMCLPLAAARAALGLGAA